MSYEAYRSGRPGAARENPSRGAYASFAAGMDRAPFSPMDREREREHDRERDRPGSEASRGPSMRTDAFNRTQSSRTSNPSPPPLSRTSSVPSSITTTVNGKVENPYSTSAYASTRQTGGGNEGGYGGVGGGMGSMDMAYMSMNRKNNMGNMQGKLKDTIKSSMAVVKQDQWKIICVKATSHDLAAPKGKHVRVIMEGLRWGGSISNRESPVGAIFHHLRKRMSSNQWIVVIKAQTIFHHIFRDGNEKFVEYVANNSRSVFVMDFFGDTSNEGVMHSGFIRSYGVYIEQWLTMKAAINFPPGKAKEDDPTITKRYSSSSVQELLTAVPVIMDTIEALLKLDLNSPTRRQPVANPAMTMLLRDLSIFWITMQEGMIRLLDLYFNLEVTDALIALDVYKRFVELVPNVQPFFEVGKSMQSKWQPPEMGTVSLELVDAMQEYIDKGGQEDVPAEPQFSDEEEYDEPEPEPVPEDYYEPEPEYYSEEEPEPLPMPRPRTPPPPLSTSSEEETEEEDTSSEEEEDDDTDVLPSAPEPAPVPKPYDPLADLLGIESGVGSNGHAAGGEAVPQQAMALQVYGAGGVVPGMYQPATLEHTVDDRIANVKGIMAAAGNANGQQQQQQQRGGFGVDGTNMQMAMYGQGHGQTQARQQQAAQQQMYNTMAMQQQQQQMLAYQTMAAYQTMSQQQMAYLMQQSTANGMRGMQGAQGMNGGMQGAQGMNGMQRMGMMGAYQPTPQGSQSVPVMQAEGQARQAGDYRVQRGTKPTRVNDDDMAFGPLLDQMKKTNISK